MIERRTISNVLFDWANALVLGVLGLVCLYPMLHVLFGSFSDPRLLISHTGLLLRPLGFITKGYEIVFNNPNIWSGYANTLFYVVVGTVLRMSMTMLGAYVLAQKDFMLRKVLMLMFVFTMYFGGGLIPDYLLITKLKMLNTRWAIIVPSLIATWNMIILRTAFSQVPASLEESARLDGAGDMTILFRIIAPTTKASIAVIIMYYAVGEWNSWFSAAIYLPARRDLYPLQLFLREILIANSMGGNTTANTSAGFTDADSVAALIEDVVRYCTIVVATVPILCVYPFVQKYFVKGVMMGSIKE
ncbi:carbohydrate ABC transporter permease [Ruminococcaceae bacterium OttesenSCG-928-L11]|nr:carbohydrate ABC transporter permease [Ruminococcaceae bacterium OttesenSCG-928-L11]